MTLTKLEATSDRRSGRRNDLWNDPGIPGWTAIVIEDGGGGIEIGIVGRVHRPRQPLSWLLRPESLLR